MKKFDGMILCVFVSDEDGKNGEFGPAPSSFIVVATICGLMTRLSRLGNFARTKRAVAGTTAKIAA
ncbi:MAG: hypothetical protein ACRD4P_02090, partial [Bryobacteraceae bacterium]